MTDEMILEDICPPEILNEIIPENNNESLICKQLLSRLEPFKTLSITTKESKKQAWLEFLSLWSDILQISPSDIESCYKECANLLPILFKITDFYSRRKDLSVARESLFTCIIQLDQSRIKTYLLLTREEQDLSENRIYYTHVYYLLLIGAQTASFLPCDIITDQEFIDNHIELFTFFIERVERNMPEHSPTMIEKNHNLGILNERILSFLWNLSDRTVLIPILLKCNLAKRAVNWISQASMLTEKGRRPLISIIHNIARHDDGADELNKIDAIIAIKNYQNIKLEKFDSRILTGSMALALLSTPEQLKHDKKGFNNVLNQLLQLIIDAAKGDRYRRDGFHVSEPLGVLVKMFVVEERTLDYILCHAETKSSSDMISIINLFISLFITFSDALKGTNRLEQFTLIALINILWSISFQPNYAQELIKNQKFIIKIKTFIEYDNQQEILEQYKPRSMEGIQQAAHGILHNLNLDNNDIISNEKNIVINNIINNKPWIMISYSHDNNIFCSQIFDLLSEHKNIFQIWIDRTHCEDAIDLWESIADGMERASVILCLISNQYFQSKSCRQEFIYAADSLKRRIIPVLLENFEPKGWLGIRMTGLKYIRFRDIYQLEKNKTTELLNTIATSLSSTKPMIEENILPSKHHNQLASSAVDSIKNVAPISPRPIDQWTSNSDDIHAWFDYNRISIQLRDLFDFQTGKEMLDYAKLLIKDREKQMDIYARIFSQKYHGNDMPPHEFNRFANALEKLLTDNTSSSTFIQSNSSNSNKSSICTIF